MLCALKTLAFGASSSYEESLISYIAVFSTIVYCYNEYTKEIAREELAKLNQTEPVIELTVEPTDLEKPKVKRK